MDRDGILSADAGDHGVTACGLALGDELAEKRFADAVADAIGAHVD